MANNYKGRRVKEENPPTNNSIRAREVRLVDVEQFGLTDGIYSTKEAQDEAYRLGLDLVEISGKSDPIICKILDYKKFIFDQKKKKKEQESNQKKTVLKEMKLSPDIGQNDFDTKIKKVKEFIEKEHKVKLYIQFKGGRAFNEHARERGLETMLRFVVELEEVAVPDSPRPTMAGRKMSYMISSKKK